MHLKAFFKKLTLNSLKQKNILHTSTNVPVPSDTIVVSAYFNPAHHSILLANYQFFWQKLQSQGIPLLTLEVAYNNDSFEINSSDATFVINLRSKSVLWQKERLFNLAIAHLPKQYSKIIFMDCDCFYKGNDWFFETSKKLDRCKVVQPFSSATRLEQGEYCVHRSVPIGMDDGMKYHGFVKGIKMYGKQAVGNFNQHGLPGFCIALQRAVVEEYHFFDYAITGSGDTLFYYGIFNAEPEIYTQFSEGLQKAFKDWSKIVSVVLQDELDYVEAEIYHLWHGSILNRKYHERNKILTENHFDPQKDIELANNGTWQWSSNKKAMHNALNEYFHSRKDGK